LDSVAAAVEAAAAPEGAADSAAAAAAAAVAAAAAAEGVAAAAAATAAAAAVAAAAAAAAATATAAAAEGAAAAAAAAAVSTAIPILPSSLSRRGSTRRRSLPATAGPPAVAFLPLRVTNVILSPSRRRLDPRSSRARCRQLSNQLVFLRRQPPPRPRQCLCPAVPPPGHHAWSPRG
ncbi:hypothetical protein CLOP_g9962, partial [Closterium sp. NIES-67]